MTSIELTAGDYRAVVDTLGATLSSLTHRSNAMILPQVPGKKTVDYRGVVCVPWPNRMADGSYTFEGKRYNVPINESAQVTALHGLGYAREWEVLRKDSSAVVFAIQFGSDPGYPFQVQVQARYSLSEAGLTAQIHAVNNGSAMAPYGSCPHPYLVAGQGTVDDWTLHLDAEQYMKVSHKRQLPIGLADVHGSLFDFRAGRKVGTTEIDHAFTRVAATDGRCEARITAPNGEGIVMSWDSAAKWVQLYTADSVDGLPRAGLAIEPMDCAPDAFNSGRDLVVLPSQGVHTLSWTLGAI